MEFHCNAPAADLEGGTADARCRDGDLGEMAKIQATNATGSPFQDVESCTETRPYHVQRAYKDRLLR